MPILLVIIALTLHLLLGWPVWVSVLVAGGGQTGLGILYSLSTARALPAPLYAIIGGGLIGMLLSYVPMIIVFYLMGHPWW
jgi:hypothetical protein